MPFASPRPFALPALLAAAGVLLLAAAPAAASEAYPNRPIKLVVPFPPGGATDSVARLLAKYMQDDLGQTIVVENRSGAGAIIGAEAVARAEPDGYTILASTAGIHIINPAIYDKLPYDPIKSFAPVGLTIAAPIALMVLSTSPFKTAQELIAYARKNPGKLSYGHSGVGTSNNLAGEMFKHAAGVDILHVPYKGAGPATTDFLGGRTDMMFPYVGSAYENLKNGKIRLLNIGSPKRLDLIKDVPTVGELLDKPDYDSDTWTGFAAPAGTPAAAIDRLNKAVAYALEKNREHLLANGYTILGGPPEAMRARIAHEFKTLTPTLSQMLVPQGQKKQP